MNKEGHFKDSILAELAKHANIAQFVSYNPNLEQRHSCIAGYELEHKFQTIEQAIEVLLKTVRERSVNIRSFNPKQPKGHPLIRGLKTIEETKTKAIELTKQGLHIIIHEEIPDTPGKTSGVLIGDVVEFAPQTTPRCVEALEVAKMGIPASLPKNIGIRILEKVYGFKISLDFPANIRVEFTVLSEPYGQRKEHIIVWELEEVGEQKVIPTWNWPNRFSTYVGDKTYGLLIAEALGLKVPHTQVIGRNAIFNFGTPTGTKNKWTRTAPKEQTPGKFPTIRGYSDIFQIMKETPDAEKIASVLIQDEINAEYSGALVKNNEALHIEGVNGFGDVFMLGQKAPEKIPEEIIQKINKTYKQAESQIGPARMEWVYDGKEVWIVQMHKGETTSKEDIIVPGNSSVYEKYHIDPADLESFRKKVEEAREKGIGLDVVGHFGVTSHIGDILRNAKVPSRRITPTQVIISPL